MILYILQTAERIGGAYWGILIPAAVLAISVYLTWRLYKRFSDDK